MTTISEHVVDNVAESYRLRTSHTVLTRLETVTLDRRINVRLANITVE